MALLEFFVDLKNHSVIIAMQMRDEVAVVVSVKSEKSPLHGSFPILNSTEIEVRRGILPLLRVRTVFHEIYLYICRYTLLQLKPTGSTNVNQ